jgi:hypothetical protein
MQKETHSATHPTCLAALRRCAHAVVLLSALSSPAMATEGGGSQYAVGVETHFAGLMLPEGFHQFLYYSRFESSHNKGNDGNDNTRLAYFKVTSNVVATRFSYVWPEARWLGANVETRAAIAIPTLDVKLGIARPAPLTPIDRSGTESGLGDLSFAPVLLGWHSPTLHQTAGVELYIPVGYYDVTEPVNTGRNYWAFAPIYAVTWFPAKGIDLSGKLRFSSNTTNKGTAYRSGNELSLEFSGNYRLSESVAVGLSGYVYRQTSDDTVNGMAVNGNGNLGRVNAIGPSMSYNFTPKFAVIAKVQQEFSAKNKPQGTRIWLQAKMPL